MTCCNAVEMGECKTNLVLFRLRKALDDQMLFNVLWHGKRIDLLAFNSHEFSEFLIWDDPSALSFAWLLKLVPFDVSPDQFDKSRSSAHWFSSNFFKSWVSQTDHLHDWMSTVWSGEDSSTFPPLPGPPAMLTGSLLSVHHFFCQDKNVVLLLGQMCVVENLMSLSFPVLAPLQFFLVF